MVYRHIFFLFYTARITSAAATAIMTVELDGHRQNAQNERVPEKEERVKRSDRRLTNNAHPRENERECCKPPKTFPKPAFNVFLIHDLKIELVSICYIVARAHQKTHKDYPQLGSFVLPSGGQAIGLGTLYKCVLCRLHILRLPRPGVYGGVL